MVESSDAGEVWGRVFYNHPVIWFYGDVVFAWLGRRMQVQFGGVFYNHMVIWF